MPSDRLLPRIASATAGVCATVMFGAAPAEAACAAAATGVNFGSYDTQAPVALDGAGNLYVLCDRNVRSLTISMGAGQSGNFAAREMTGGPDVLQYNLYTTSGRTQVWGDGTGGTGAVTVSARRFAPVLVPVYGRVPALQNVPARSYGDTLIVTIEF